MWDLTLNVRSLPLHNMFSCLSPTQGVNQPSTNTKLFLHSACACRKSPLKFSIHYVTEYGKGRHIILKCDWHACSPCQHGKWALLGIPCKCSWVMEDGSSPFGGLPLRRVGLLLIQMLDIWNRRPKISTRSLGVLNCDSLKKWKKKITLYVKWSLSSYPTTYPTTYAPVTVFSLACNTCLTRLTAIQL